MTTPARGDTPLDLDAIEADLPSGDPTQPATFQLATAGHHVRPLLAEARRLRAEVERLRAEATSARTGVWLAAAEFVARAAQRVPDADPYMRATKVGLMAAAKLLRQFPLGADQPTPPPPTPPAGPWRDPPPAWPTGQHEF